MVSVEDHRSPEGGISIILPFPSLFFFTPLYPFPLSPSSFLPPLFTLSLWRPFFSFTTLYNTLQCKSEKIPEPPEKASHKEVYSGETKLEQA
jgi:hypothetical protein